MSSNNEQTMIEYPIDTFYNMALNDEESLEIISLNDREIEIEEFIVDKHTESNNSYYDQVINKSNFYIENESSF
ncbi:hypothetical protein M9Y10_013383 [Tritrichomonas musculus]|uniref:Uncharacterized protein n=1 Tax=Tritrichomonas musculus TaxID=1915356 RepID=A0ABR2I733_9EUKA